MISLIGRVDNDFYVDAATCVGGRHVATHLNTLSICAASSASCGAMSRIFMYAVSRRPLVGRGAAGKLHGKVQSFDPFTNSRDLVHSQSHVHLC